MQEIKEAVETSILEILGKNNGAHFGFLFKHIKPRNAKHLLIAQTVEKLKSENTLSIDPQGNCYLLVTTPQTAP